MIWVFWSNNTGALCDNDSKFVGGVRHATQNKIMFAKIRYWNFYRRPKLLERVTARLSSQNTTESLRVRVFWGSGIDGG